MTPARLVERAEKKALKKAEKKTGKRPKKKDGDDSASDVVGESHTEAKMNEVLVAVNAKGENAMCT